MIVFKGSSKGLTRDEMYAKTRGVNGAYCFWDDQSRKSQAEILYPNNFFKRLLHKKVIKVITEEERLLDEIEMETQRELLGLVSSGKNYAYNIETSEHKMCDGSISINIFKNTYQWYEGKWDYNGGYMITHEEWVSL